jgi:hypothetical protein
MQERVVWCPVGKSRAVGLHMLLAKLQLILRTDKERPKHVQLLSFLNKPVYCDIQLDIYTYCKMMHGTMNLKKKY